MFPALELSVCLGHNLPTSCRLKSTLNANFRLLPGHRAHLLNMTMKRRVVYFNTPPGQCLRRQLVGRHRRTKPTRPILKHRTHALTGLQSNQFPKTTLAPARQTRPAVNNLNRYLPQNRR
jgi:hypothetical protein